MNRNLALALVPGTCRAVGTLSPGQSAWLGIALSRLTTLSGAVWGSVLATLILLISLSLRSYWALGREPPCERLTFFRTMLVISGRLVIARLAAVPGMTRRSPASPGTRSAHAQGCGAREGTQRCLRGRVRRPRSSIGQARAASSSAKRH